MYFLSDTQDSRHISEDLRKAAGQGLTTRELYSDKLPSPAAAAEIKEDSSLSMSERIQQYLRFCLPMGRVPDRTRPPTSSGTLNSNIMNLGNMSRGCYDELRSRRRRCTRVEHNMLAQLLAKQTGHMCGLTVADEVLGMRMFPLLRENGWTSIIFSRSRTLLHMVRGNTAYHRILVDRTTNDCPFGADRGVYFIITETGFGPDPGDSSQPLLRAGLNVVRSCLFHIESKFARKHENSRMQILEMLAWVWHLEVDNVMGDGNCATYRYFKDQAAPNWARSDLRVCMDKMIQAQRVSVNHCQRFMCDGQWIISTAFLEWTKYQQEIKRYNSRQIERTNLPRKQQVQTGKEVCPWGETDVVYAMIFFWGHSCVEHRWRLDNLSDAASAGGPVPPVMPDFKVGVSEYSLALDRVDSGWAMLIMMPIAHSCWLYRRSMTRRTIAHKRVVRIRTTTNSINTASSGRTVHIGIPLFVKLQATPWNRVVGGT